LLSARSNNPRGILKDFKTIKQGLKLLALKDGCGGGVTVDGGGGDFIILQPEIN
jgi:hypothetical protein